MLSKSFKAAKCKTSLKLAAARMKLMKNKREVQLKQMKRDVAQLLESGQEQTARIRVEHVVREEKTMAAYDIIELYCELVVARLPIIESQKNCPIDLKEAIASILFASPRCADVPELLDVRKHFTKKYGKEFITAALELRPDSGVSHTIVEKLSAKAPDGETKIKILTAIAKDHNVKWDPNAMKEQTLKPPEDLLNGPSKFVSASKMHVESPNIQFQPPPGQKQEPTTKYSEEDVTRSSSSGPSSSANMGVPASAPTTFSPDPHQFPASGGGTAGGEFRHPFSYKDQLSLNRQSWNMEFKDATSAAQAAAESAEMASMAARAAAHLASHGKVTGEYSTESQSSYYGPRDEVTGRSAGRRFKDERDQVRKESDSSRVSHEVNPRMQNEERDEMGQHRLAGKAESIYDGYESNKKSSSKPHSNAAYIDDVAEAANLQKMDGFSPKLSSKIGAVDQNSKGKKHEKGSFIGDGSFKKQSGRYASAHSSMGSMDDEISAVNLQKADRFSQKGFSDVESVNLNQEGRRSEMDDHHGVGIMKEQSGNTAFPHSSMGSIDNISIWDLHIQNYDKDVEQPSIKTEERNIESSSERHNWSDPSAAVFDEAGSDCDPHLELENNSKIYHFDTYIPSQEKQSPSQPSSSDTWNSKQWRSKFVHKESSVGQLHFVPEPGPFATSSEDSAKEAVPMQESLPATFDDSDDLNSGSEDEDNFMPRERTELSGDRPAISSFSKEKEAEGVNAWSHALSNDSDSDEVPSRTNQEMELNVVDELSIRLDPGYMLNNQPIHTDSPRKLNNLSQERFSSSMKENQQHVQPSRFLSAKEVQTEKEFGELSQHSDEVLEFPDNLSTESGKELNFGRLTGGLRNKGFRTPPYTRDHSGKASSSSKQQTKDETSTVSDVFLDKTSGSPQAHYNELCIQKANVNVYKDSRSASKTFFDSDNDDNDELQPRRAAGSRGHQGSTLSLKAKDSPTQSVANRHVSFSDRYQVPIGSDFDMGSRLSKPSASVGEPFPNPATENVVSENVENPKSVAHNSSIDRTATIRERSVMYSPARSSTSFETHESKMANQNQHTKEQKESVSIYSTDSDSDSDGTEKVLPRHPRGNRGYQGGMLSRRTRNTPTQPETGSPSRYSGRSNVPVGSDFGAGSRSSNLNSSGAETHSKFATETIFTDNRENPKSSDPNSLVERPSKFLPLTKTSVPKETIESSQSSAAEQPPKRLPKTVISGSNESEKSSSLSGGSTLRENSLKTSSHVHPRLPDYDTLAAHLESLRSDRRPK